MFDDLVAHRPPRIDRPPTEAVVVQVANGQVFAAPIGGDTQQPLGPFRGKKTVDGNPIPVGAHVLIVFTDDGPWITAIDE